MAKKYDVFIHAEGLTAAQAAELRNQVMKNVNPLINLAFTFEENKEETDG